MVSFAGVGEWGSGGGSYGVMELWSDGVMKLWSYGAMLRQEGCDKNR